MKKFLTLVVALVMVIPMMAIGRNDGSTKANAIDFDWGKGIRHPGGTKWYRVNLDSAGYSLYEQENPSLTLYLTNPSQYPGTSVDVSMKATVAGQSESKSYTIAAHQYKTYTANASMLVRMKQTEIYLTLTSTPKVGTDTAVLLSAKVFESSDLDETCKDAELLKWGVETTQNPMFSKWWKINLTQIKDTLNNKPKKDAKVTIRNIGSKTVNLKAGQSLDCPSSGTTRRDYVLAPNEEVIDTIPLSMILSVQPDELYFGLENVESKISIRVDTIAQPKVPVISDTVKFVDLDVTDTIEPLGAKTYYRIKVADMDSLSHYEPEFTYRNVGTTPAKVTIKMAFEVPAYGTTNTVYELAPGDEEIVVYKKNMLQGMTGVEYIYLLTLVEGDVNFYGRFKHIREGKACKTNIDFNWESGHSQEARTTQWYAIPVKEAKDSIKDIRVHVKNEGTAKATLKASMAFSCPYIDLQEVTRTIEAGTTMTKTLGWSTFAMTSDTIWMGIETNQNISFRAEMIKTKIADEPDTICLHADTLSWENGSPIQEAGDTVWYVLDMKKVRGLKTFPMVYVYNYGTGKATVEGELSLECPDSIPNQKRSITIEKDGVFTRQIARTMFQNIDTTYEYIYLRVVTNQKIKFEVRFTEAAAGSDCGSAINFNWISGNSQKANESLWYAVDLRDVMHRGNDLKLHIENRDNTACKGVIQLSYECPVTAAPSIQNFSLAANAEKKVTIQNSALETLTDSVVYVNLQGTTGLRFWADTLEVQPFDTIKADGITLIPLEWDSLYTQTVDTAWYIITKTEIDRVRNMDDQVKPVAHLYNLGNAKVTIKAEAAFAFPIGKKMMTKTQELKAKQHYSDTVPATTFEQIIGTKEDPKKDSIILRVTRPAGSANFQFRAELVKAFGGNSRNDALPIRLGERYAQSPNTEMWYKISTADWKKDTTLYNKALNVMTKNAGKGDAKVSIAVYEGLLSETDMLEEYGLDDYRERTVEKGQGRNHNVPAQVVYALGDVELYIKVRSTDSLVFESKFTGEYAPQAVDPKQKEAKLVVPNVDYVIPGDNQEHWYMVCVPYINSHDSKDGKIKRNYKYIAESSLTYELNGKAKIEVTGTFQDEMNCKMPVRKRTINRADTLRKGTKPLWELINRGIKKATKREFDVSTFQPSFVDSMLHVYLTSDSITGYLRIKSDKEIKVRLNTPQITGDRCDNAMMFDWEHGNVNAKDSDTWYQVVLINPDSTLRIPDTCDIRIHVDNWSDSDNTIDAGLFFDCNETATVTKHYVMPAGGKDSIDVDRDRLAILKANMLINFKSTGAAHIWAELIDTLPRQILDTTITRYICYGETFIDTVEYKAITVEKDTAWTDTVHIADGVTMIDSLTTFDIHTITVPTIIKQDSLKKLNAAPLLVQGMQLYVEASNDSLMKYYQALGTADSLIDVDTVYWAKPVYKPGGDLDTKKEAALDLTKYYTKTDLVDTLLLVMKGGCEQVVRDTVVFTIDPYKYAPKNDTVCPPLPAKNPDTLTYATPVPEPLYYNRLRYVDTVVTYFAKIQPALYAQAQILLLPVATPRGPVDTTYTLTSLKQQFEDDATPLTMQVTDAKWQVQKSTGWSDDFASYTVPAKATSVTLRYIIDTECGVKDTSENVIINVPCENDTIFDPLYPTGKTTECDSLYWALKDTMIYTTGVYYHVGGALPAPKAACKEVYVLDVTINHSTDSVLKAVEACESYTFQWVAGVDTTITTPGTHTYKHTYTNAALCDSVVSIDVTIYNGTTFADDTTVCDEFRWQDAAQGFDTLIITPGTHAYTHKFQTIHGCDSVVTMTVTVNQSAPTTVLAPVEACLSYTHQWVPGVDTVINTVGKHTYTHMFNTILGCDSLVSIDVTIYKTDSTYEKIKKEYCNLYEWTAADTIITETGKFYHTFTNIHGCDSVACVDVVVNGIPYYDSIEVKTYYGYRIIMINRTQVNDVFGWTLDSLHIEHPEYVIWHSIDLNGKDEVVGNGYYYTLPSGDPLPTGYQFYAMIDVPASVNAKCGVQGKSQIITVGATSAAPALIPSLAKPGEEIQVVNLDPTVETVIRIYTAEGLLQKTYKSSGETSFTIKAASDLGFYLVELSADSMKSTLRYIVK